MNAQEFAKKEQQTIQADLFNALNSQIEMAKNKLGHGLGSIVLGEYSLTDATEEMEEALSRIENIDKLLRRLMCITRLAQIGLSNRAWRHIGEVSHYVIESLEATRARNDR